MTDREMLQGEISRLNRSIPYMAAQSSLVAEVPIRIHSRETDSGGAPEWHESFERWIDAERDVTQRQDRFYESDKKMNTARLKRALRQLRRLAPKEYDALYLMLVLGYQWPAAREKMNADCLSRGQQEYTEADFLILTISGSSLLLAGY